MKKVEIEFDPGEKIFQMINNRPTNTRIKAYAATGSYETSTAKKSVPPGVITERIVYSTFAQPNKPVTANALGRTVAELFEKMAPAIKKEDEKVSDDTEKDNVDSEEISDEPNA